MANSSEVRASDAERERAAREIREHYAAGRLSEDELSDRLEAAYAAQTRDELEELRRDLPRLPATKAELRAELAERRGELQRRLLQQTGGSLVPFGICTAIWLMSGAHGEFWPVWVLLFTVIALLRSGWRLYGPSPELDRVERELARRERGGRSPHHRRHRHRRL